jgi:hypothetical protein
VAGGGVKCPGTVVGTLEDCTRVGAPSRHSWTEAWYCLAP